MTPEQLTPEQLAALDVARDLARLGAPLFLAPPDHTKASGFALPPGYQNAAPDPTVPDHWQYGWAIGMVTGAVLDVVDVDAYAGGQVPAELPEVYAVADTPSGGRHLFVAPLGVESRNGAYPGVDVKSGAPDGTGRGFVFLAPTERPGKGDGVVRPYVWRSPPDLASSAVAYSQDTSGALMRQRIEDLRAARSPEGAPRRLARSAARSEWDRALAALVADLRQWAARGWGGEAHAGLLRHTTHLARLSPDHAEDAYLKAFHLAGLTPDEADLAKLESALRDAVPDVVVDDEALEPAERFWLGGGFEADEVPKADPPAEGEQHRRRGGFVFLTEEELDALPAPDPLVEGLLWQNSVARLFGPSGVGKTWVALDLAAHVACGLPWMGREVKQGRVVFVAAEGAPSLSPRAATWRAAHGRRTEVLFWPEAVSIAGENWEAFCETLAEAEPTLVLMDTQAAMTVGRRENDNTDMGEAMQALTRLRGRVGCCALLIHHTGHEEQERARGASAVYAALDTELQLEEAGRGRIRLRSRKQRYGRRQPQVLIDVSEEHDGWVIRPHEVAEGVFGDPVDVKTRELLRVLVEDPSSNPSMTGRQLETRLRDLGRTVGNRANSPAKVAVRMFMQSAGMPALALAEEDDHDV